MTVATTVGPLEPEVRDAVAAYRDEHGHKTYNETLAALVGRRDLVDRTT